MTQPRVDVSHYTYRVSWSAEDREFVGTCVELPSLSWLAPDSAAAILGIEQLAADVVRELADAGEPVPAPLSERSFSGKFLVRVSPHLHRLLTSRAAEEQMSLNRFVEERLAAAV
ncbi:toxin-antitoxin system HicB family antitoxin [Nocardioides marmoriginsengisoli]|uniref:Toxin-antitoxin system HicB family antitoxin n=1 Tax=Nocardioides marmoriginsengisoli TaxID=661483 RepID=A0A3N0CCD2_9ACTN|nr:toxin-antitoxin system HicB family antitoxin [Nocardioides marmoriginsengisoli]RNL61105.1 toxin-antitoxin system HicB family antitoxin [Nocardioides marmoriginsengisoli]